MVSLAACVALPISKVQAPTVPLLGSAETPYPTATSTATPTITPKPTPTSSAKWDVMKLHAAQTQIAKERAILYPPSTPNPGIK